MPGPVSQGDGIAPDADPGDVGDAADIHEHDRKRQIARRYERLVVSGHDGRALPALGDVCCAEIEDGVDADPPCEVRAIADLDRQSIVRTMQHGLPVKADEVDGPARDRMRFKKTFDGLGMAVRHHPLGVCDRHRSRLAAV